MTSNQNAKVLPAHYLSILAIGNFPKIKISELNFVGLRESRKILASCLAIEDRYKILTDNYIELEKELVQISVADMVRDYDEYGDFFEARSRINLRYVNLLTAARLYVDQLPSLLAICADNPKEGRSQLAGELASAYDSHFEFRFMSAIRNHVQHSGLPVHSISKSAKWIGELDGERQLRYSTVAFALKKEIEGDSSFKKSVLREMPEKVDLLRATRRYLESLSEIHGFARRTTEKRVDAARKLIESMRFKYKQKHAETKLIGLSAIKHDGERIIESVPLLLDWDDVRVRLQRQGRTLKNLHRRYVCSSIDG